MDAEHLDEEQAAERTRRVIATLGDDAAAPSGVDAGEAQRDVGAPDEPGNEAEAVSAPSSDPGRAGAPAGRQQPEQGTTPTPGQMRSARPAASPGSEDARDRERSGGAALRQTFPASAGAVPRSQPGGRHRTSAASGTAQPRPDADTAAAHGAAGDADRAAPGGTEGSGGGGTSRSHTSYENRTVEELRDLARERDVEQRSKMDKDELIAALRADREGGHSGGDDYADRTINELRELAAARDRQRSESMTREQLIAALRG